jgi:hypothetical protein
MKTSSEFGAALRWSIQAREGGEMCAVLQGLPRPAGFLKKDGRFTTAYCTGIDLMVIKLEIATKEDDPYRGPIPILFSRDEDKTKKELAEKPSNLTTGNEPNRQHIQTNNTKLKQKFSPTTKTKTKLTPKIENIYIKMPQKGKTCIQRKTMF